MCVFLYSSVYAVTLISVTSYCSTLNVHFPFWWIAGVCFFSSFVSRLDKNCWLNVNVNIYVNVNEHAVLTYLTSCNMLSKIWWKMIYICLRWVSYDMFCKRNAGCVLVDNG